MENFVLEWANLLIRWGHLIAGIGWIGTSFYFVALDMSLRRYEGQKEKVAGSVWEVHGGGFYHVEKYRLAPDHLPKDLVWYKWEAYLTWVTGMGLMAVQYYTKADLFLIDSQKVDF
ncbi:MAG: urate hydroxylase PuuD [Pseudomonadota bacterium]